MFECEGKKCMIATRHEYFDAYDCIRAPSKLIAVVVLSSALIGGITFATSHLILDFTRCESIVGSISLLGILASFGLMPMVFAAQPGNCADVIVMESLSQSYLFPLNWLTLAGSLMGIAMACLRLRSIAWRDLHSLTRSTICYFMFATGFNIVGLVGAMLLSCVSEQETFFGEILLVVWLGGSIGTTVMLHNLMALRAEMFVDLSSVVPLRRILRIEILIVISVFVIGLIALILTQVGVKSLWIWIPLICTQGCLVVSLFVIDLVFSLRVLAILRDALKKAQLSSSNGNETFARSLRIATLNIVTVFISVCTTSIFYCIALIAISLEAIQRRSSIVNLVLLLAWVFDSLGNDACAIYIGFGPIGYALQIVASAKDVNVIGNPVAPVNQEHATVVGHVLASSSIGITNPGRPENSPDERKQAENNKMTL